MRHKLMKRSALGLLLGICGLAVSLGSISPATALEDSGRPIIEFRTPAPMQASAPAEHVRLDADQPRRGKAQPAGGRKAAARSGGQYFVEFRSRYALSYGHTFLVHGRLGPKGEVKLTPEFVAGLHPRGEGPQLWTVGHVMPVPSETGPSDGDLEEEYVSARFRVLLTEAEYRTISAHIRHKQQNSPTWHAVFNNCNQWVGEIAQFMGLKAPSNNLLYPADYINNMREINGGESGLRLSALGSSPGTESYAAAR